MVDMLWRSNLGQTSVERGVLAPLFRGKAVQAEGAQCSPSFPAGILPCGGFGRGRRRLGALTVSAADTGFTFISIEERQAQLTSGTKAQAQQPGIQVPACMRPGPVHSLGKVASSGLAEQQGLFPAQ